MHLPTVMPSSVKSQYLLILQYILGSLVEPKKHKELLIKEQQLLRIPDMKITTPIKTTQCK